MESSIAVFLTRQTASEPLPTLHDGCGLSMCVRMAINWLGLRDRISPICTLSQNGYGDLWMAAQHPGLSFGGQPVCLNPMNRHQHDQRKAGRPDIMPAYLLGLLAMIKCSICSYQCDN